MGSRGHTAPTHNRSVYADVLHCTICRADLEQRRLELDAISRTQGIERAKAEAGARKKAAEERAEAEAKKQAAKARRRALPLHERVRETASNIGFLGAAIMGGVVAFVAMIFVLFLVVWILQVIGVAQ